MADRLKHRGKLTSALARALVEFTADKPDARLASIRVDFFNKTDEQLARVPLAEALNAIAFDLPSNGRVHWHDAIDVEIDDDGDGD